MSRITAVTLLVSIRRSSSAMAIAEEDLRIETSYPFNKVTALFLLDNYHFSSKLIRTSANPNFNCHFRANVTVNVGGYMSYYTDEFTEDFIQKHSSTND